MTERSPTCPVCGMSAETVARTASIHCPYCVRFFRTEIISRRRRLALRFEAWSGQGMRPLGWFNAEPEA